MIVKFDYRAIYIHCDGSMQYDTQSSGGIGYVIKFPEDLNLNDVVDYDGIFVDSNIERLELNGLIKGIQALRDYVKNNPFDYSRVSKVVVITDRFALQDSERTNAFKIREWRSNHGRNFEGKEIKNWDLINNLDKERSRLSSEIRKPVFIEYRPRKQNKEADKLSKRGRKDGLVDRSIAIEGQKIGSRKFDGPEIDYKLFNKKEKIVIHIFRKRLIKNDWEVNAEICSEKKKGSRLKIQVDYLLQEKLQRGNVYEIRLKEVYNYHLEIFRILKKLDKKNWL